MRRGASSARAALLAVVLACAPRAAEARAPTNERESSPTLAPGRFSISELSSPLAVRLRAEIGSLGILAHHIRYGAGGTRVDYRDDANQDTLFFFFRLSGELSFQRRHTMIFVYQPLDLQTEAVLERDLLVGETTFPEGAAMRFGYGFDFYRVAYQFDLYGDERRELAFGGGFQLRNARVGFFTQDGEIGFSQTNLGVVPLLRFRGRYLFDQAYFLAAEVDGLITPIPAGRGPDGELSMGAILDASLRAGLVVTKATEVFLNLRYLGGGFRGESSEVRGLSEDDTWTENWLHTLTVSLGLGLR